MFVAVDGEAIDGRYVLLARDTGEHLIDLDGLHTVPCLEWLLDIPRQPGRVLVCFGLNYDVNNWLADLPHHKLEQLWTRNKCRWRSYKIEWLPGRWFSVKHLDGRYVQVCECFGFFQQAFVGALREWGLEPPAELEAMKRARGTFTQADQRRVIAYCVGECRLLVELMDRLAAACHTAQVTPRKWIGAGSLAAAALGAAGVSDHHQYDLELAQDDQLATDVICGAYFGGRIELLHQGEFAAAYTADLRSAYPAAITQLPSLRGATVHHRARYSPQAKHAIWRVKWRLPPGSAMVAPFPVRQDQRIYYPLAGEGCYHAVEVRAALAAGYPIDVLEGWVLRTPRGADPFSWVPALYQQRARLKRRGDPAQRALKLALNSCYGKLAQGYGYNSRPRYQSYFWAGEVTATTRAALLTRVAGLGRTSAHPIMLSTDGVFSRHSVRCSSGDRLGTWEAGYLAEFFAAQPGVYQGYDNAGGEVVRSRGFFARDLDYDQLRDGYQVEGAEYVHTYQSTRFIGMGAALHRGKMDLWRRWVTEPRSLALMPERKHLAGDGQLLPPPGPLVSDPYVPKQSLHDGRALDYLEGMEQPLREAM